jgi:hypothetical protein
MTESEDGIQELRKAAADLREAVEIVRNQRSPAPTSVVQLPSEASSWNFVTFEKYINQRFSDLSLQLRERYEAQQTGLAAALAAAEKAVNAALIAAEKAVDKAEGAQQLRNEAQNEFRKSLSDLSGLMWTIREGQAAVNNVRGELISEIQALRREWNTAHQTVIDRLGSLEAGSSNIQGRIWAISAVWAVITVGVIVGARFIGH